MKTYPMVLGLALLLLLGCGGDSAPGGGDVAGQETPVGPPTTTPDEPIGDPGTAVAPESSMVQVAPASTVVLGELTPEPAGPSGPIEQPRPGRPNPLAALTSRVGQDLSDRLRISPNDVSVIQTEAVDWPDSGLGCPRPGIGYATVITPGYRIVLQAREKRYTYHTDAAGSFVLCQAGRPAR